MNASKTAEWLAELTRRAIRNGHAADDAHYLSQRCAEQVAHRGHLPDSDEHRALQAMARSAYSRPAGQVTP